MLTQIRDTTRKVLVRQDSTLMAILKEASDNFGINKADLGGEVMEESEFGWAKHNLNVTDRHS